MRVGGDAWRDNGQWVEWEVEVPEDGMYNISFKGRQNYSRGSVSTRSVLIDGEVPFIEASEMEFPYSNDWIINPGILAWVDAYPFVCSKAWYFSVFWSNRRA